MVINQIKLDKGQTLPNSKLTPLTLKQSLSKQRRDFEMALFDFERKRQWKQRFVDLFNSILRKHKKNERLMKVIGFHKFCRNVALITKAPLQRIYQPNFGSFLKDFEQHSIGSQKVSNENIHHLVREERPKPKVIEKKMNISNDRSRTPNDGRKATEKVQQQNTKDNLKKRDSHKSINQKLTPKQQQETNKEYNQIVRELNNRVTKLQAVSRIFSFHQRLDLDENAKLAMGFAKWLRFKFLLFTPQRYSVEWENQSLQEELNSVIFVLNERVFRENFMRTKLKLAKTEMESKITLVTELLQTILAKNK